MGDGGFTSQEFEVQQQLGRLSWVQESPRESPLQAGRTVAPEQACMCSRQLRDQSLPSVCAVVAALGRASVLSCNAPSCRYSEVLPCNELGHAISLALHAMSAPTATGCGPGSGAGVHGALLQRPALPAGRDGNAARVPAGRQARRVQRAAGTLVPLLGCVR